MAKRSTPASRTPTFREHYARELAKIDEQFQREMRGLWARLHDGPKAGESLDRFGARLFRALELRLQRVRERQREALFDAAKLRLRRGPGRPRTRSLRMNHGTILTGWRPPVKGRPPGPLSDRVSDFIAAAATHATKRPFVRGQARAQVAADLKVRDIARYRELMKWQDHYEFEEDLSPDRALARALGRPLFQVERRQAESLARRAYYALGGGRRAPK
jgi:hypothetical protein